MLGWPPSPPPPSHTEGSYAEDCVLELLQAPPGPPEAVMAGAEEGLSLPWLEETTERAGGVCLAGGYQLRKAAEPGGVGITARVTVAATAIARERREAADSGRRLPAPLIVKSRGGGMGHLARPRFNFDSAQDPSPGMTGAGVAVPLGFSDSR